MDCKDVAASLHIWYCGDGMDGYAFLDGLCERPYADGNLGANKSMNPKQRTPLCRAIFSSFCFLVPMAVAMFLPAGFGWWKGWLLLAVFFLETTIAAVYLWRRNPDIFLARSKLQNGTKGWGKALFCLLQSLIVAILPVAACDKVIIGPCVQKYCV